MRSLPMTSDPCLAPVDSLPAVAVPPRLAAWLAPFRNSFTAAVWPRVLVLLAGAILAPGPRTVSAALRVMGLADQPGFGRYHEVLSEARWDGRALARTLLVHLLDRLLPEGEVVIVPDDSIERRWGPRIRDRGIYRDPVRSSRGFFVKTSGLRWLSLAVVLPIPWARRRWALPFLTILAPSQRANADRGRRHKPLTRWAIQAILQIRRWLPERAITIVGDSSFASLELIAAVRRHVRLIPRLRLDASLFAPAPLRRPGQRGPKACKGQRLPKLTEVLANPATRWTRVWVSEWYGDEGRVLAIVAGTAIWYHAGRRRQSAGCWCAIPPAGASRRPSSAPTSPTSPKRSSAASSGAGGSRPRSRKCAVISASRPSGSGRTWPSTAPRRCCLDCSRW